MHRSSPRDSVGDIGGGDTPPRGAREPTGQTGRPEPDIEITPALRPRTRSPADAAPRADAIPGLSESLRGVAAYAEGSPFGAAVLVGAEHTVQYVNPTLRRLTGTEGSLLLGQSFAQAFPDLKRQQVLMALRSVAQSGRPARDITIATARSKAAAGRHLRLSVWPLRVSATAGAVPNPPDRALQAIVVHLRDTRDEERIRKRYERERDRRNAATALELRETNQRLILSALREEELGARARIASDAKATFLAAMSHELRTPLNAIIGYTSLLDEEVYGPIRDEQHHYLGRIKISARHLLTLIDEVLTFSRLDAGQERVVWEDIDGESLLAKTVILTAPLAAAKGLTLTASPPEPPFVIASDSRKLLQILVNLVTNAIKFTERGEVTLTARTEGEYATFAVHDTGVGIPAVHLDHIFDAFWQVDQGTTRHTGGAGLGLSVSQKLARLLGGDLTVQSTVGGGSTFTLLLPLTHQ